MKKIMQGLLLWLSISGLSYAFNIDELPNKMYLTEHWVSYTTSFDIETNTRKLGTLYRRVFTLPLTYDFYDNSNRLVTTAKARFFSLGGHFDIYNSGGLVGTVEEKIFTFLPSFIIYSTDSEKLARAEMNFWGTTLTIYDMPTNRIVATMSRPFFRIKNDWTILLKDRALLKSKNIDPGLFMTVLAFQADREYWEQQSYNNSQNYVKTSPHAKTASRPVVDDNKAIQAKVASFVNEQNVSDVALIDPKSLEVLATKLESDYQAQRPDVSENADPTDEMNDFVDYCFTLVQLDQTSPSEKRAILYLLQQRLGVEHTETEVAQ